MKYVFNTLFLTALLLTFTACSDDDESPSTGSNGDDTGHGGSASFTVSGDLEGEHTGIADFRAFEINGIHTWDITLIDQNPITFNISFAQTGGESIDAPTVGVYPLEVSQDENVYLTTYEHFDGNPFQGETYTAGIDGTSGVMEITTSTESLIEGTFSFTAARFEDGQIVGSIEVTNGEFSAVPRP
ncbi:hypothetical protein G3O08_15525 [Cryomorpha ignava]|uniref:Lipoprotein n=1 Tax=Cryomorpha ignava TaxID=101383 RepID=A0A7K3WTA0_9FLAO|nr:DUF6252 family protein [Cryomorpha ignava]NEN24910.1 hypothetical protein [Cryomorpha ignava]